MSKVSGAVRINRPVSEVFSYVSDPRNLPSWDDSVKAVEFQGPAVAGSGGTILRQLNGTSQREDFEIHTLDTNRVVEFDAYHDHLWTRTVFVLKPAAEGTELEYEQRVHGEGIARLLKPLAPRAANAQLTRSVTALRAALESGRTPVLAAAA